MLRHSKAVLYFLSLFALLLLSAAFVTYAQQSESDETTIRAAIKSYVEAYNKGDAKAVAEHWSETGEWVSPSGEKHVGKEAIAASLKSLFDENKGVTIKVDAPEIRMITPDVAVEEGVVHVSRADESPSSSTYQAIHVKQKGEWKLNSVRETEIVEQPASSTAVEDLAWLVGDWSEGDQESTATVRWTKNKTFLSYSFKVRSPDGDDLEVTQVIGWDPVNETTRSWMFDSDGGFGEGVWSRRDNTWVVKFSQTLADGRTASATNIYTPIDDNHFTWKSVGREVDGEFQPNTGEIKLTRAGTIEMEATAEPNKAAEAAVTTEPEEKSSSDKPTKTDDAPK